MDDENSSVGVYPSDALLYAFELPAHDNFPNSECFAAAPTVVAAHRKMVGFFKK